MKVFWKTWKRVKARAAFLDLSKALDTIDHKMLLINRCITVLEVSETLFLILHN